MLNSKKYSGQFEFRVAVMRVFVLPIVVTAILLIAASIAFGMPPHPTVAEKIASGKIARPEFMNSEFEKNNPGLNSGGEPILRKSGVLAKPEVSGNFKILTILVEWAVSSVSASKNNAKT